MTIAYPITFNQNPDSESPYPLSDLVSDFDPSAGCYSDAGFTLCEDADPLQEWHEQSLSSIKGDQTDASAQPVWYESDVARNSKPYVDFDGSDWVEILGTLNYRDDNMTIYLVMDPDWGSIGSFDTFIQKGTDFDWDDGWVGYFSSGGSDINSNVNTWSDNAVTNADAGGPAAIAFGIRFKTDATVYRNGNQVDSNPEETDSSFVDFPGTDAPLTKALIGTTYDSDPTDPSSSFGYTGKIFRILIYSEYHDTTTFDQVLTDLQTEYNI
ncbi:MAG: hypothetical protein GOVbin3661_72 [Prokaryotic dsDNA virus sp.]|nr:MAG: hypothetical protein GOVbin3661_72 [Prokaryotic dsDNA virus sp.]|tara:strand:+ start:1333 stop:2136 length:804 start_codon:yes stop_codon:yes gene_type:complete